MSSLSHALEPDAQAIFLLCGRLGSHEGNSAKPLTRNQYNEVANWLHSNGMRPGDLLNDEGREQLSVFGEDGKLTEDRLCTLLDRGTAMAMAVEEWTNKGGWILTRSDKNYPTRFRKQLRHLAPPILYGVGDPKLLEYGGVSMVGSRDSDDASLAFIRDLARRCAEEGVSVVSGGARGVDQASMDATLEAGGIVVGALANGLAKTSRKKKYREAITDNRLALVSAYHPDSRFQVWKAMERNKHIYALGDGTVVAHSAEGSGGTWSGATENLDHGWVPLFVRAEPPIPDGNRKLIERGGCPIDRRVLRDEIRVKDWLFGDNNLSNIESAVSRFTEQDLSPEGGTKIKHKESPENATEVEKKPEMGEISKLFPLVWPAIKKILDEPRSEQEVREYFDDLRLGQARDWLMMAVDRGLAIREERPVRYTLSEKESGEGDLPSSGVTSNRSSDSSNQITSGTKATDAENGESRERLRRDIEMESQDSPTLFDESSG